MVLELKEYTMASLGYKSSENPLISPNQTRPSPFSSLKLRTLPSSFEHSLSLCLSNLKPVVSLLPSIFFVSPFPGDEGQLQLRRPRLTELCGLFPVFSSSRSPSSSSFSLRFCIFRRAWLRSKLFRRRETLDEAPKAKNKLK